MLASIAGLLSRLSVSVSGGMGSCGVSRPLNHNTLLFIFLIAVTFTESGFGFGKCIYLYNADLYCDNIMVLVSKSGYHASILIIILIQYHLYAGKSVWFDRFGVMWNSNDYGSMGHPWQTLPYSGRWLQVSPPAKPLADCELIFMRDITVIYT